MSQTPERETEPVADLRNLSMQAQPQRDLWPAIASRIAVRKRRQGRYFFAAAACTVLAFSAMLTLQLRGVPEAAPRAPLVAPPEFAAMTSPRALRATRPLVKANLRLAQDAEAEVVKAMRQSPGDPSLQRLLEATREQKRELDALLVADRP
jgi:hypothetical protein